MRRAALDLETAPNHGDLSNGYALEPWRARHKTARITSMAVTFDDESGYQILEPSRRQLIEALQKLKGFEVWGQNTGFDVAWLIASIEDDKTKAVPDCIMDIRWRDTQLLAKWITNGRPAEDMHFSYSLVNMVGTWLKDMPGAQEFVAMKKGVTLDPNSEYWDVRGQLDALWTLRLAKFLMEKLPEPCLRGFIIEQHAIPMVANSWLMGMRVIKERFNEVADEIEQAILDGSRELGISTEVMSSPAQLGRLLYDKWGLPVISVTKSGKPSTDADTLKMLEYQFNHPQLKLLMETRRNLTLRSKYIYTTAEALARTGDGYLYAVPRMFGTTTGRLTYSNETTRGVKVSIAAQQMPRKAKNVRSFLAAPEGMYVFETDAASQESRIMGIWSRDPEIIRIFNEGMNFHSYMASRIYGRAYEEFQQAFKNEDPGTIEQRQFGKLTNLSCNFRIGGKKLAHKAFIDYDTYMAESDGRMLVNTFQNTYVCVPKYWKAIIAFAKEHGYSYTLAQRRYKVGDYLKGSDAWKVEGTVISHPIQGTGADMFYAAVSQVREAILMTTLHDGLFWAVREEAEAKDIVERMNATPYDELWGEKLPIQLLYEESKLGLNFSDVK